MIIGFPVAITSRAFILMGSQGKRLWRKFELQPKHSPGLLPRHWSAGLQNCISRKTAKRLPSVEPKSDNSGGDSQPKRQRTESSGEDKSDNTLLKSTWRTRRLSGGLVRLGSEPERFDLQTFPLINHSLNVRRRVELIGDGDGKGSPLVIDLPDCPGNLDVFTTIGEFCLGLDEKGISVSNVVKLIAASTFLEMESLTSKAFKFLEESAFNSWESCLSVVATFEDSDMTDVGEGTLFHKCERALLQIMSSSTQRLLHVAELLPPYVAKHVYLSCRMKKTRLFYDTITPTSRIYMPLVHHTTTPFKVDSIKISYFLIELSCQSQCIRWIEELSALLDWSRRLTLVIHLAKSTHLENGINFSNSNIQSSILSWGFLSAILVELVELRGMIEFSTSPTENLISDTEIEVEIANLLKLVGCGLGEGEHWSYSCLLQQEFVLLQLKNFKFDTLLSVVRQFKDLCSNHSHISIVARVLDDCLLQQVKSKRFTVQPALLIYQEFPNDSRSSHAEIYHVFEDVLRRKALSTKEALDLTKLLDYKKLSDEVVENLMADLPFDCDPLLRERCLGRQRARQIDQEQNKEELINLQKEHNMQTADLLKVRLELSVTRADLAIATEDIQLAERISNHLRHDLEEKQRECQSYQEKSEAELMRLRNQLNAKTAYLNKVRKKLSALFFLPMP